MSDFMDKRIMELSRSYSDDFSELSYPQRREEGDGDDLHSYALRKDDFDSSFHFHPIDPVKSGSKNVGTFGDAALISLIECKMKEQSEILLHAVEGLSLRLCQVESKTRQVEHSIEELKDSTNYHYGRTEGKLRELENILREVQNVIQDLRDRQEISEVKSQIEKLKMVKGHEQSENQNHNVKTSLSQGISSYTQQQRHQPNPTHVASVQQQLPSSQPNVPPVQYHQKPPPTPTGAQLSTQLPHNYSQVQSSYSQPVLNPESAHHQQYSMPPPQQSHPPPSGPYQAYRPKQHIPLQSQLQQLPQLPPPLNAVGPQAHHSMVQRAEMPYMPSQSYSPNTQMTFNNAPGFAPPQQINLGSMQRIHDQPSRGPSSDYLPKQPSRYSSLHDAYSSHAEFPSQSHYSSSRMRPSQIPPSSSVLASGSSFSRLPTAQLLPHALPMASNVDSGSSSSETGNSLRVEDVIDDVVAMGFRRDTVRATVRKITKNGQSVDLNMVLDKLMNNGEVQS